MAEAARRRQAMLVGTALAALLTLVVVRLATTSGDGATLRGVAGPTGTPVTPSSPSPLPPADADPIKDPFCALVDGTTGARRSCPEQPAPGNPQTVRLVEVFLDNGTPHARVVVSSRTYVLHPGDPFATSYRLVSLSEGCGAFSARDEPFRLCEGEETVK